ncbi:MAG: efflux RND transporter periplasmic adaptor subunit [Bacteroidetes bacterium]|nr:efflux RND transporter periplasmic adaptor subunit [Bacteroidota bacterium]
MAKSNKKSKKKLIIFGSLGLLVVIFIVIALVSGGKEEIIMVQTEKVEKRDITQTVTATGQIDPEFKVLITPEVTGEIIELPVKEGDNVKKGDFLSNKGGAMKRRFYTDEAGKRLFIIIPKMLRWLIRRLFGR